MGRQTTKEQIDNAVLDGETCFTDPGVVSGWLNSVPTEDLPTKATLGSNAPFAERVHPSQSLACLSRAGTGFNAIPQPSGHQAEQRCSPWQPLLMLCSGHPPTRSTRLCWGRDGAFISEPDAWNM